MNKKVVINEKIVLNFRDSKINRVVWFSGFVQVFNNRAVLKVLKTVGNRIKIRVYVPKNSGENSKIVEDTNQDSRENRLQVADIDTSVNFSTASHF